MGDATIEEWSEKCSHCEVTVKMEGGVTNLYTLEQASKPILPSRP